MISGSSQVEIPDLQGRWMGFTRAEDQKFHTTRMNAGELGSGGRDGIDQTWEV